jgi:hypothetical protein
LQRRKLKHSSGFGLEHLLTKEILLTTAVHIIDDVHGKQAPHRTSFCTYLYVTAYRMEGNYCISCEVIDLIVYHIVACMSDCRRGFGLDIRFIDHLQVITTNNYNTIVISTL